MNSSLDDPGTHIHNDVNFALCEQALKYGGRELIDGMMIYLSWIL